MAILSGRQITKIVEDGVLTIKPFYLNQVQPASYDLRLGKKILASPLSQEKLGKVVDLSAKQPSYEIQSGQMVGIISLERLEFPLDLCGRFGIRSSFARLGIEYSYHDIPIWRGGLRGPKNLNFCVNQGEGDNIAFV